MKSTSLLLTLLLTCACSSEPEKRVWFVQPADGATIKLPYTFKFGVEGMDLVKAGEREDDPKAGHHHIIVDGDAIAHGTSIASGNPKWLHYGGAQTEASLTLEQLPKGKHKLTLQFGDCVHKSYGPSLAHTINITVQ